MIIEGTMKDYPTRHRAGGEEQRVADGKHAVSFFSVPKILEDWGSQRSLAEANPSDLIRHIPKRLSGPALSLLAAPHKVDEFLVLPIYQTRCFAEGTVKAMASGPPKPATLVILWKWHFCRMFGGLQLPSRASKAQFSTKDILRAMPRTDA